VLVDTPYRLLQGQRAYVDFYLSTPPVFALGGWLAFLLGGVSWMALVNLAVVGTVVAFGVQSVQLRSLGWPLERAAWAAFACQAMVMVTGGLWWYNPVSVALAVLLFCQTAVCLRAPDRWLPRAGFALVLALVLLSKPNTAILSVCFCLGALLLFPGTRRPALVWAMAGSLAALGVLWGAGLDPMGLLKAYGVVAGRARPGFERFSQDRTDLSAWLFLGGTLLATCAGLWAILTAWFQVRRGPVTGGTFHAAVYGLIALAGGLAWLLTGTAGTLALAGLALLRVVALVWPNLAARDRAGLWLALGAVATGLFACFTNAEIQVVAFPLLLLPLLLLGLAPPAGRVLAGLLLAGAVAAVLLGWSRYRVQLIGPGQFYQAGPERAVDRRVAFFKGFQGSPALAGVVADLLEVLGDPAAGPKGEVFFGPRLEWAYAAFRRPSPRGLPIWWDPDVSYPAARAGEVTEAFRRHRFDPCILLGGEMIRMPAALRKELLTAYVPEVHGALLVLRPAPVAR
jgi:hypothetical protein